MRGKNNGLENFFPGKSLSHVTQIWPDHLSATTELMAFDTLGFFIDEGTSFGIAMGAFTSGQVISQVAERPFAFWRWFR